MFELLDMTVTEMRYLFIQQVRAWSVMVAEHVQPLQQITQYYIELPRGRSNVFDGVLTTGRDDLCLPPRRNPVLAVSTSDMIPGSSSNKGP